MATHTIKSVVEELKWGAGDGAGALLAEEAQDVESSVQKEHYETALEQLEHIKLQASMIINTVDRLTKLIRERIDEERVRKKYRK